jgi:hypothetical protein
VERLHLALALSLAVACGAQEERKTAPPSAPAEPDLSGLFEVSGYTTVRQSGDRRRITGTVIIARSPEGASDPWTATFDLDTEFPTPGGPVHADVIGAASARTAGRGLAGKAETRILMASVPGLDPAFPWIPGRLGPRIVSSFEMEPEPSGTRYRIEIESQAAPGERYEATRTSLRAQRAAVGPREAAPR